METAGQWLEAELNELCRKTDSGLQLDADLISGLVSFCELAPPLDAADYLTNIIGADAGHQLIQGYLQKRGHLNSSNNTPQPSTKPGSSSEASTSRNTKSPQKATPSVVTKDLKNQQETKSKKKKGGKSISLVEASKGSVVFKQGQPCSCQARRHGLVSNCLSCGKIVCEQEGEGPCTFCGALVLKEGSNYAGLTDFVAPVSKEEEKAEQFAKRLVDYDRNSAARTKVIDDQSDYYEIESNSWLSKEEKEVLKQKQEAEEAAQRKNLLITIDLVGRKVVSNRDVASEEDSNLSILRPNEENCVKPNPIKPNPTVQVQPVYVQTGPNKGKENKNRSTRSNGLCLEITGRVQSDDKRQLKGFLGREENGGFEGDDFDRSHDFD